MHVICWDLDETLGYFRPIAEEMIERFKEEQRGFAGRLGDRIAGLFGKQAQEENPAGEVVVREGIGDVLRALKAEGFRQVVTTGSFEEYGRLGLEKVGLLDVFEDVFGRERVWDGHGKIYQPVIDKYGVDPDQLLIVGDSFKRDRSSDHHGVVLICQPEGLSEPAAPLLTVIRALAASETFGAGFERLLATAQTRQLSKVVTLDDGLEACFGHWGDYRRGERTPVISALRAVG